MGKPAKTARPPLRTSLRKRPRTLIALGASVVVIVGALIVGLIVLRSRDGAPKAALPSAATERVPAKPVPPAPRPTTVIAFAQGCVTPACHAALASAPTIHAPVAADACETCHEPDAGNHTFPVATTSSSLCLSCHDVAPGKPFKHAAMTETGCLACHDPHTSTGPFLLAASTMQATCAGCHPIAEGTSRHPPYAEGECLACHEPHAANNPRLLAGPDGDSCALCHQETTDAMERAPFAHRDTPQSGQSGCLACHAPHASNHAGLLAAPAQELCLSCHEDVRQLVADAPVRHDAIIAERRCMTCHTPHASDNAMMLVADQSTLCLGCHDKAVTAHDGRTIPDMTPAIRESRFVHGPVESNQCGACHGVHGSRYARLLREINPEVLIGSFDIENYALCFSCHTQNLVLEPRTTVATEFRNGDLNLHYIHVKKGDRARSCGTCHRVHGSELPFLMANTVAFQGSDWMMPVKFQETTNGGSCAPGCHEPLSYDRSLITLAPPTPSNPPTPPDARPKGDDE